MDTVGMPMITSPGTASALVTTTMATATTATTEAVAVATARGGMGGMRMGTGCKISMLWNWNTVDACFLSSTWRIKSTGMFAGSCIGVVLLVVLLEGLRRSVKEYDHYLLRKHVVSQDTATSGTATPSSTTGNKASISTQGGLGPRPAPCALVPFRPSIWQQAVRALLHMLQFAVAYFIMLLAMYYNGYFIICIFLGAYIGAFFFQWETMTDGRPLTGATQEATVCCG